MRPPFLPSAVFAATTMLLAMDPASTPQVDRAYLGGQLVALRFAPPQTKREKAFLMGPWIFGAKIAMPAKGSADKPHDRRLNLYIVSPGAMNDAAASDDFDHTVIINARPETDGIETEFDVYYAVVLDPQLRIELRSERELLLATQEEFVPGDLFDLNDVPSAAFLSAVLQIDSLAGLRRFRKPNGAMPRVAIVPAGFALRAAVAEYTQ